MHDGLRYSTTTRRIEPRLPMMSSNPHVLTRPARKWCKKSVYGLSDKLRQSFVCFSVWIFLFIYFLHTIPAGNSISYDGANLLLGTKGRSGSPGQHGWDFGGGNVYRRTKGAGATKDEQSWPGEHQCYINMCTQCTFKAWLAAQCMLDRVNVSRWRCNVFTCVRFEMLRPVINWMRLDWIRDLDPKD